MLKLKAPWNERNGRFSILKLVVFLGLFAPAVWIVYQAATGMLDPKPVTEMIHRTGDWTVRFILLSLLVTPVRRLAQWPKLIAVRRMLGVAAFAYAFAHLSLYVVDQKYNFPHVASEIVLRFYLTIGFVAWLGLAALSATSTDAMIRRLGAQRWNRLHKLIYGIAVLAIFHFYLQSKADVSEPVLMMGLYFILMLTRLLQARALAGLGDRRRRGDRRADRDGAPRGDLVRSRPPHRFLGGALRQLRSRHGAERKPARRACGVGRHCRRRRAQLAGPQAVSGPCRSQIGTGRPRRRPAACRSRTARAGRPQARRGRRGPSTSR